MQRDITIYHLQMTDPDQFRPSVRAHPNIEARRAEWPCPEINRFFYSAIGGDYYWIDKLVWNYAQWKQWAEQPDRRTWIGYLQDTPVGYFELKAVGAPEVEIEYFGILRPFRGRGIGAALLAHAVKAAWTPASGGPAPRRIWLHTCTLDHPHALRNYQQRGFTLFKADHIAKDLPDTPPGPWPGANS